MPKPNPALLKASAPLRAPTVQVPEACRELLENFCVNHKGVTKSDVVRAALETLLPGLESGELLIANGKIVSRAELAKQAAAITA